MAEENMQLIHQNRQRATDIPPNVEESHPWLVEGEFTIKGMMMEFAAFSIYGSKETFAVRAKTAEDMQEFLDKNQFHHHPRLLRLEVIGPNIRHSAKKGERLVIT